MEIYTKHLGAGGRLVNLKIVWKTIGTRLHSVLLDCVYRVEVVACVGFCGRNTFHHTFFLPFLLHV